ncbi:MULTISPECIES: winged helix-turn-helix domain-containing protein [unclassified Flavobacterium]|uniref:winged helix-turn-helix domain-containing protein n=1 Tax=unclassified Flavobacterium TaxID=196869 RepID=UPI000580A8E8|nr:MULTISPECIES: LysR family transcriptional regulator [unclassified Flavobacterium]KIA94822.1 ModE family transcriptional regulator [Flavobacterium sp. KMS]MEA9415512.1 LysR family transcriptional regulator [Flavobacterium sp. PL02]
MGDKKKYSIEVRLWIEEAEGPFLGIGKIWLLENIKKTGSITNAAKEMKMAYRQAWQLVEEMNQRAESPLVEKLLGGKGGGGARLTEAGETAITVFYEIEKRIKDFAQKEAQNLRF